MDGDVFSNARIDSRPPSPLLRPTPALHLPPSNMIPPDSMFETMTGLNPVLAQVYDDIMAGRHENGLQKTEIPIARIKSLMKRDGDVAMTSCEAPQIMSKASALFIANLTSQAWNIADQEKRRTIKREDVMQAIQSDIRMDFLYDIIADPVQHKHSHTTSPPSTSS